MWNRPEPGSMMNPNGNRRFYPTAGLIVCVLFLIPGSVFAGATKAARPEWQPVELSLPPRQEAAGVVAFPCVFTPQNDRCAWDAPRPPALDPSRRVEITLSCDKPELVRGVTLYLRSGNGWYSAVLPIPETIPRPASVTAGSFSPEGQPAGWDRIDAIRLAVWKRSPGECTLRLTALSSVQDRVFVLQAGDSAPASEKGLAETLSRRVSNWLTRAGIGHALVTEKEWMQLPASQTRFAILPYNPLPPAPLLKSLEAVIGKGGKLLVCYGASPELATRMGFRLAPYKAAPTPSTWSTYRFDPPVGSVSRVFQESPNLIPVFSNTPQARVLAWWENTLGERRQEPAWLGSPAGYWMTHTLEAEDASLKTRVLLEWIASTAPEAWEQAGQAAMATASAVLPPPDLARLQALAANKAWKDVVDSSAQLRAEAARRKAASLPACPTSETAAVWAQPGPGFLPADWTRVAAALKQAGIRRVYLSAVAFGRAHAESSVWPRSDMAEFSTDPFGGSLKAAQAGGLSVHAWITCFNVAYTPPARMAVWRLTGRLMQTPAGEQPWLTPTHPENTALLLDGIEELATRYPVNGIQLDYVRYSEAGLDITPCALKGFEAATGVKLDHAPADVLPGGPKHEAYKKWLMLTLEKFVKDARDRVRRARPGISVSAAVFPAYPYCRDGVLQDWKRWLENDAVDAVCPMSYSASLAEFRAFIAAYKTMPGWGSKIYPGIGVYSDSASLTPEDLLDQVETVRAEGGAGTVFFIANREFLRDCLPILQPALD